MWLECVKIVPVFLITQWCHCLVYSAGMPAVGISLPSFLVRNAFQALKQFLAWVAERTGKLNVIIEALRLVSSSQLSNVKLPEHPELGGCS